MSEDADLALNADDGSFRGGGAVGIGEAPTNTIQVDRGHDRCVSYCLTPGQRRRGVRCPSCYGPVAIRAITGDDIEPAGTRWAWWWGAFLAGWAVVFRDEVRPILARREPKTSTEGE